MSSLLSICPECLYDGVCGKDFETCNSFSLSMVSEFYPDKEEQNCTNCQNAELVNDSKAVVGFCDRLNINIPEKGFRCNYYKIDDYKAIGLNNE